MTHPAACDKCRAPVRWAVTPLGKRMPLNPQPDPAGNVAAHRDGTGRWCARVLRKDEQPFGWERRYMPHFATCPARAKEQPEPAKIIPFRRRRRSA